MIDKVLLRSKLKKIEEIGINPYPNDFRPKDKAKFIKELYKDLSQQELENKNWEFSLAGRLMAKREMGKLIFAHIQDQTDKIQILIAKNEIAEDKFKFFKKFVDIGDIIGVKGKVIKTKTGEVTILVREFKLLTKSLRPLPEKYHGLKDTELRYRMRYLDLVMNPRVRQIFIIRTRIIQYIRDYFISEGFLEVETPMMHPIAGGAAAKPFVTYHNALDMNLYLRIAPELYLKRLIVGGFERVFEINRNFRNEGLSTRHNPEFTMIEFYQAYATYHDFMDLTESLRKGIASDVCGSTKIHYQGDDFDFSKSFDRLSVFDSILKYNPQLKANDLSVENAKKTAKKLGVNLKDSWGLGRIQIEIFEATVEEKLIQPTFITQYPTEVSPLSRRNDEDPFTTDRFELFIGGREIANGFSELNDAEEQAQRFQEQAKEKDAGNDEAMHYDADYIRALEYGMPPTAGEGIGVDRLVMFFTNSPS